MKKIIAWVLYVYTGNVDDMTPLSVDHIELLDHVMRVLERVLEVRVRI